MRLSVRLIALGVSGPIVGLGMFLAVSMVTSIQLAQTAKTELTALFDQDNRTKGRNLQDRNTAKATQMISH